MSKKVLGINGIGRIGKMFLWNQFCLKEFDEYVINVGRTVGRDINDFIDYLTTDSTYGELERFLHGYCGDKTVIDAINHEENSFVIEGTKVTVLTEDRNPANIKWGQYGADVVVDCTGVYKNPDLTVDEGKGILRGHIAGGAKKVIVSAPFDGGYTADDAHMIVYGINHDTYESEKHDLLSAASCTTTALSHMLKPLVDDARTNHLIAVSMSTIHAATNNQTVLDTLPQKGAKDLRRNRSVLDNIIITSTGAAKALKIVMPEIKDVPFMADSIRIPTSTVSLVSLNISLKGKVSIEEINEIYRLASIKSGGILGYSERQGVSTDFMGHKASAIIEAVETNVEVIEHDGKFFTHAKISGWYDNEFGNYVNSLSNLVLQVQKNMK